MYLATVTCNRDFQQMLLQAESIGKFVEPCSHVIVVNEDKPDLEFWYRWLKPYYKNHKLNIIPRIDYFYSTAYLGTRDNIGQLDAISNGWRTQQLQKLLLAYEFEDDYLLLDSKNFFVRKTNINEWDNIIGSGTLFPGNGEHHFTPTISLYSEILDSHLPFYLKPQTPFKIKRLPFVNNCKRSELGYLLFYPEFKYKSASEGIFYSHFVKDEIIELNNTVDPNDRNYITMWAQNKSEISRLLFDISLNDKIKIVGFHRELLSKLDEEHFKIINFWLASDNPKFGVGLTNKIYPMPRDSHV